MCQNDLHVSLLSNYIIVLHERWVFGSLTGVEWQKPRLSHVFVVSERYFRLLPSWSKPVWMGRLIPRFWLSRWIISWALLFRLQPLIYQVYRFYPITVQTADCGKSLPSLFFGGWRSRSIMLAAQEDRVMAVGEWEERWENGRTGFHQPHVHR